MAAPTETYVDPSIAGNSGAGTIGDPYGDLQYALDQVTRDGTNGDRFNILAGTDEILSAVLSIATYGTPSAGAPLVFQGYTSAAGDGGIGGISGNGSAGVWSATGYVTFRDLHLHNCGSATIINVTSGFSCHVIDCELDNTTGDAIDLNGTSHATVLRNNIHNIGTDGVEAGSGNGVLIAYNYFKNGTNDFANAINLSTSGGVYVIRNIISIDGASNGINPSSYGCFSFENSILSSSGTGFGIDIGSTVSSGIVSNLVEGFSGAGGKGIVIPSGTDIFNYGNNGCYNNTTNYDESGNIINTFGDNETLSASPFAKSGSDTFANRFTYFAPVDTGNVFGGAYQ